MSQATSSLARAWSATVGANALILVFGIATGILAARMLGPADRGVLAVVMFWPGLLGGVGFLSLGESIVFRANRTPAERRRFLSTVTTLSLSLAIPVMLFGTLLLPLLLGPERADALPLATAYLLAFVPLNFVVMALLAVDQAERCFFRYNIFRLLVSGAYLPALLLLWAMGAIYVATALWAGCLGTALTGCVQLWLYRRDWSSRPEWREAIALLRQGTLFHSTTLVTILSTQADRLIVMRFFADADIGYYVVALTIATTGLGLVTQSVHTVLFPHLAADADRNRAVGHLRDGLRRSTLFLVVGTLGMLLVIPWLLPMLFGANFVPAIPVAMLLAVAFVPLALRQIAVRCLRAFADAQTGILVEVVALVGFAAAVVPATRLYGLSGVPVALLLGNAIALVILAIVMQRRYCIAMQSWLLPCAAMLVDMRVVANWLIRVCRV